MSPDESLFRRTSVPLRSSISLILLPSQIYAAINVSRFDTFLQRGCCSAGLIPLLITNIENEFCGLQSGDKSQITAAFLRDASLVLA